MSKIITIGKDGFVDLTEFKDIIPISLVKYYSVKANKNKTLMLKFYDKDQKLVKPIKQQKTKKANSSKRR